MKKFQLVSRVAGYLPFEIFCKMQITTKDNIVVVTMPEGWIRIDLAKCTVERGEYEG
jgi:hypothetical protein